MRQIYLRLLILISTSFDRISELMGVPSASFIETYARKVNDLMMNMVEYILAMDNILNTTVQLNPSETGTGTTQQATSTQACIQLKKNENGYPILPDPIPSEGMKKTAWDSLFTDYLGQHYHLACGGKTKHVPYKRISENQKQFINSQYLPRKTTFRPPRNIGVEEIKSIFEFLLQRQRDHGPEDTFKFKSIKLNGKTVQSQYKPLHGSGSESSSAIE